MIFEVALFPCVSYSLSWMSLDEPAAGTASKKHHLVSLDTTISKCPFIVLVTACSDCIVSPSIKIKVHNSSSRLTTCL